MAEATRKLSQARDSNRRMVLLFGAYTTVSLACLIQWNSPFMWSRINLFTAGFLMITGLRILQLDRFYHQALRSHNARREFSGIDYDPAAKQKTRLPIPLSAADMLILLDYGHWHLAPVLENLVLQAIVLAIYVISFAALLWVDSHLMRYFSTDRFNRKFVSEGPYRYARHPRYTTIITYRVAYALVFASIIGWVLVIVWGLNIMRRIRVEEAHMQDVFDDDYRQYQKQTASLFPGVY